MAQGKVHRKLKILNDYLRKDLTLANARENNPVKATELATAQLGITLGSTRKARRMYKLVSSAKKFYQQSNKEYSMKVAMFVSRHKVLTKADYLTLQGQIGNLKSNLDRAVQQLPKYVRHPLNPFCF